LEFGMASLQQFFPEALSPLSRAALARAADASRALLELGAPAQLATPQVVLAAGS
jgi:hypothetical protein